jgi:hypothetical protein
MSGKPLRVKITGDISKPATLKIVDADTGEPIPNVVEATIHLTLRSHENYVELRFWGGEVDVVSGGSQL